VVVPTDQTDPTSCSGIDVQRIATASQGKQVGGVSLVGTAIVRYDDWSFALTITGGADSSEWRADLPRIRIDATTTRDGFAQKVGVPFHFIDPPSELEIGATRGARRRKRRRSGASRAAKVSLPLQTTRAHEFWTADDDHTDLGSPETATFRVGARSPEALECVVKALVDWHDARGASLVSRSDG
jgi:hypothetical protein